MIIHKIPKPISLIGEYSNKSISFSTCNFSHISNIGNNKRYLLNKSIFNYYKYYFKNFFKLKSNIIKNINSIYFPHFFTTLFGNINYIHQNENSWFNIKIPNNKLFFENILMYHIRRKNFNYKHINNECLFNNVTINKMVEDFYDCYINNDIKFAGKLIDSFFRIKTKTYPESANDYIYKIYSECRLAGAIGGKMDENVLILIAPKEQHENIDLVMKENIKLKTSINTTGIISEEIFGGNSNCCK